MWSEDEQEQQDNLGLHASGDLLRGDDLDEAKRPQRLRRGREACMTSCKALRPTEMARGCRLTAERMRNTPGNA